jgi:uncharacterized protein (TIGR02391 family)
MVQTLPILKKPNLEQICRDIADTVSHRELTEFFNESKIVEVQGGPRWERMLNSLDARQIQDRCSNGAINLITKILHPSRFRDNPTLFNEILQKINFILAFYGLKIGEDSNLYNITRAETLSEAQQRSSELIKDLRQRYVCEDVLRYCKPEYLEQNYFHCVLEAAKSLAQRIREKTGLKEDGCELVDKTFSIKNPLLAINSLSTETEKSEHTGYANYLKGIFGMFRNVTAHTPKILWAIDKQHALDALTIISYASKRLEESYIVPRLPR